MARTSKRTSKRVRNLIATCALTSIIFMVSTYAWFIGMSRVDVSSFDVEIASTDSLLLSLDGRRWDTTVNISKSNLEEVSYSGHTNKWGGKGLIPISTVGEIDTTSSRLKLFEKASLNPTAGGFRLLASRMDNALGKEEPDGYVVFDLFVRNFTGAQYLEALNVLDEEAIYLTIDSKVEVAEGGVRDTGIENSVRVAFAQIGRVAGTTTDPNLITGITCNKDEDGNPSVSGGVTGICRTAQIWEPNDKIHVQSALNYYNTSCQARTGTDVTLTNSYGGACSTVEIDKAYPTYAIKEEIEHEDNVDIYDGLAYNTYEGTTQLESFKYFTDTDKMLPGTQRPTFITLAPNSITKVRIYVYIEGQDVDNYDFASIGKKISVAFGFTKERYEDDDPMYDGPDIDESLGRDTDTTKPVITVIGEGETVAKGDTYTDKGATASDPANGLEGEATNLTSRIQTINPVDTTKAGVYTVTYNVSDWAGNYAEQKTRIVTVTE